MTIPSTDTPHTLPNWPTFFPYQLAHIKLFREWHRRVSGNVYRWTSTHLEYLSLQWFQGRVLVPCGLVCSMVSRRDMAQGFCGARDNYPINDYIWNFFFIILQSHMLDKENLVNQFFYGKYLAWQEFFHLIPPLTFSMTWPDLTCCFQPTSSTWQRFGNRDPAQMPLLSPKALPTALERAD